MSSPQTATATSAQGNTGTQTTSKSFFEQVDEAKSTQGKFIKLVAGEKRVLQFNVAKATVVEADNFEKTGKVKKARYVVIDPKVPSEEKFLELALGQTDTINALLKKGMHLLEIQRQGSGRDTKYIAVPV